MMTVPSMSISYCPSEYLRLPYSRYTKDQTLLWSSSLLVILKIYEELGYEVAQWLRHYTISRKVTSLRPDEVNEPPQFT
jgi:hypothetical protein